MSDRLPKQTRRPKLQKPVESAGHLLCPVCGVELDITTKPKPNAPKPHKPLPGQLPLPFKTHEDKDTPETNAKRDQKRRTSRRMERAPV